VTPNISLPVGVVCSQPAPASRAWERTDKALKKQGVPPTQRPRQPAPNPPSPTTAQLALRWLETVKAQPPDVRLHAVMAAALSGTATFVEGASALFRGVQVRSPIRSHPHLRVGTRDQHVADYCATHPGTPDSIRIRGGEAVVALVGRARLSVCAHQTTRVSVAITDGAEETSRELLASDLSGRTLDRVQGHTRRGLVEVFMQDWKSYEGWSQLTKPPGDEGARHRVILSLRGAPRLFLHPDQQRQRKNNLPAYPVGSRRAHVQGECLVDVIGDLVASDNPQDQLKRFTQALHEVFAFGHSQKHMIQRPWGRLEPTPSLKYRADEVMRHGSVHMTQDTCGKQVLPSRF
jgi:hypothetical protein